MKYCISGRQPKSVLKQADEIKIKYKDKGILIDYIEEFPDKVFILEIPEEETEINWELLRSYTNKVKLILELQNLKLIDKCHLNGINFYWKYPISNWFELDSICKLNPCYILLTAPLSLSLDEVKRKTGIKIRLCPNLAYDAYIPRTNGICGQWVRPEDANIYEEWVEVFEFITDTLTQEQTLLEIYKNDQNWNGNLNLLFTNFGIDVDNRGIPEEIGRIRSNCGQKCMQNGSCRFCENAIRFSRNLKNN